MLRKTLIFLAGLMTGWFPPEAVVMLMEPPPGTGRPAERLDLVPITRHPTGVGSPRQRHRMRRKPAPRPR